MDLICKNLGKRYGLNWIVKGFDHSFKQGNTYAITGPNGSGKSTLLQILAGNVMPSRGHIDYIQNDKKIPDYKIFKSLSICTPYLELIEEYTLDEMLEFHFKFKSLPESILLKELPEKLMLGNERNKFLKNFSSGMKQRVKLGLSILSNTELLFLDEPGSNLDKNSFNWYLNLIQEFKGNKMIFIASNQESEYRDFASEVIDVTQFKDQ